MEEAIDKALNADPVDIKELYRLSRIKGGFQTNKIRRRVWPKLLGINRYDLNDYKTLITIHRDRDQLKCDIDRSLWSIDCCKQWAESQLLRRRKALFEIIIAVLCNNTHLYYFQGYHDIVSVLMLVLNDDVLTFAAARVMSQRYFRDFMGSDFETLPKIMAFISVIIKAKDQQVASFLEKAGVEPFFATSWLLTWFAHDIKKINDIARAFDAMLCSHPLFSLYLCASVVLLHREELLKTECEFALVHNFLARIPQIREIDFESLLVIADELMVLIPPSKLVTLGDPKIIQTIKENKLHLFVHLDIASSFYPELTRQPLLPDLQLLQSASLNAISTIISKQSNNKHNGWLKHSRVNCNAEGNSVPAKLYFVTNLKQFWNTSSMISVLGLFGGLAIIFLSGPSSN